MEAVPHPTAGIPPWGAVTAATSGTRRNALRPEAAGIGNRQADGTSVPAAPICADFHRGKRSVATEERRRRSEETGRRHRQSGYRTPQLESHINAYENTTKPIKGIAGIGGVFEDFRKVRPQPAGGPDAQDRTV